MAWRTPQTAWTDIDSFQPADMERVEQNIEFLAGNGSEQQLGTADNVQHADMTVDSLTSSGPVSGTTGTFSGNVAGANGTFSGALSGTSVNTGHGAVECYDMDQPTRTSDTVSFAGLSVTNKLLPVVSPSAGSISRTSNGSTVFASGFYDIILYGGGAGGSATDGYLEKYINGGWRIISSVSISATGTLYATLALSGVISSGSNLRLTTFSGGTHRTITAYYNKY